MDSYLIHYTDTNDNIDPKTGKLKIECVVKQTDHLRDYSNNVLGVFKVNHVFWAAQPNSDKKVFYRAEWIEGSSVEKPRVPHDFVKDKNRGFFFLNIKSCHNRLVQFEDDTEVCPECRIVHTPTNANFWHVSLRWFFDGEEKDKWSGAIKRRMSTSAKAFIVENAEFGIPRYRKIAPSKYQKQ